MLGIVLYVAYYFQVTGSNQLEGSQILIFIMLTVNIIPVLKRILKVNIVWQAGRISFSKLLQIVNSPSEITEKTDLLKVEVGKIQFDNVSFSISNKTFIFDNVQFTVPGYGFYLLNGEQGSGKTTIFKLLLGLYQPNSGAVLIDGKNVSDYTTKAVRKNISMVSSELTLLGKTLFEAVSYSRKEEKKQEIEDLLVALGFFNSENVDLSMPIIDGGKNLSNGQRKLLIIVRALLSKKKILLLDEPFTDLDDFYKEKVIDLLKVKSKTHTIIIIDKDKNSSITFDGIINF